MKGKEAGKTNGHLKALEIVYLTFTWPLGNF